MIPAPEPNETLKLTVGLGLGLGILFLLAANLILKPRAQKPPKLPKPGYETP